MGRKLSPENVALRDQVLALLRDRGLLTTIELCEAIRHAPLIRQVAPAFADQLGMPETNRELPWKLYPQLNALARLGVIRRVPNPGSRSVGWMLTSQKDGRAAGGGS